MYMSRITLDARRLARNQVYEAHQALWKLFSDNPDRQRDFLYRSLDATTFLTVSAREPEQLDFVRRLDIKPYAPKLATGDRVLFSLRFNPVVKRRQNNRQIRVDMVQDERKRLLNQGLPGRKLPTRAEIAQGVAREWLAKRQKSLGLRLENVIMAESYDQQRFSKKDNAGRVVLSRIDARGFAKVSDPDALCHALFSGVGCAKGFGFGLLLVRRA